MSHGTNPPSSRSRRQVPRKEQRELAGLKRALAKEQRENARLRRQLAEARRALGEIPTSDEVNSLVVKRKRKRDRKAEERLIADAGDRASSFSKSFYISYLIRQFTISTLYRMIRRITLFFRRFRLIRTIIVVTLFVLTAAAVSAVLLSFLPFAILITGASATFGLITSRRMNRRMKRELAGKHIRVIVLPDEYSFKEDTFLARSAHEMAGDVETAVIVVTPHAISARGLGGQGAFFTARKESEDLYLVRRHYFFLLRRKVLDVLDPHVTVIY